ncbi:MAG TPA: response regulator [Bacteroidales bacterium]|nr:response regulator [Bacteroidales bacterium]HPT20923.1 response regulator [Bacteroidales bacterium]
MVLNINNISLTGKNIIIVEDDVSSIKYYETLFYNTGANVKVFRTGKEFVDFLNEGKSRIDFIFMDFLIPIINGIDCIRIFRKENKNTPLVLVTAYSSEQAKTEAYIAGCTEYVLKPIYPEKVFFLIEKYLLSETPAFKF